MKTSRILMSLLLVAGLASCADDPKNDNVAEKAAGTYNCYSIADCAYFKNSIGTGDVVTVTSVADNSADVSIVSGNWGTVSIPSAAVVESAGSVIMTGTGTAVMGMGDSSKSYECALTATVSGATGVFTVSIPSVMGGLTLTFNTGEVPVELVLPGEYSGWVNAAGAYFPQGMAADGASVTIAANDADGFSLAANLVDWGTPSFDNIEVTRADGKFNISGTGTALLGMGGGTPSEYPVTLTGTMSEDGSEFELVFHLNIMGGVDITFLEGTAPA